MLNTMHDGCPMLHGVGVSGDAHDHCRQLHQARIVITTARPPRYIFEKHHISFWFGKYIYSHMYCISIISLPMTYQTVRAEWQWKRQN